MAQEVLGQSFQKGRLSPRGSGGAYGTRKSILAKIGMEIAEC